MFDSQKQDALNTKHGLNPEVGDYWHEMYMPARVVLAVDGNEITICEDIELVSDSRWRWDHAKIKTIPRIAFSDRLRYQSDGMRDKFWCHVIPGGHVETAQAWQRQQKH